MRQLLKKLTPPTATILFGTFFTRTAFFMSTPFLSIYLTSVLHIPLPQTGMVLSACPLIIVLLSGFIGNFTDKLALRSVLVFVAFFGESSLSYFILLPLFGNFSCSTVSTVVVTPFLNPPPKRSSR